MNRQLLTLLLLSALAYSCASPIPISKLSANDNEGKWIAGRKFITKELNGHYITLSYYRNDGDMLIFDVLYDNRSSDTLIFDPSNALISAYAPDMFHLSTQKAVDPEHPCAFHPAHSLISALPLDKQLNKFHSQRMRPSLYFALFGHTSARQFLGRNK